MESKSDTNKITYFLRDDGACGYYRVSLPFSILSKKSAYAVNRIKQGDGIEDVYKAMNGSQLFVIPRVSEDQFIEFIKDIKNRGKKVVIDHDDNMFCISPLSPHYEEFGTEEVKYKLSDGELLPVWEDGRNIDISANRKRLDGMKKALELADMVTVTTAQLADVYREFNSNIRILPNCVNTNLWRKLPLRNDKVRLFWGGGHSHYEDWCILSNVLPEIMNKYTNVFLILMGAKFNGTLKKCPEDRIEFHPWAHIQAYPYMVSTLNPDIALIPLLDNKFNRCKSPIKWIEMGALEVPSVASYVSPYKEIASEDNGIFIEDNNEEGWFEGISMLIEDKGLRDKFGKNAYKTVQERFDINTQYLQWLNTYEELF